MNAGEGIGQQDIAFRQMLNSNNEREAMQAQWTCGGQLESKNSIYTPARTKKQKVGERGIDRILERRRRRSKPSRSMFRIHGVEGLRLSRWVWVESIFLPITIPRVRYCKFLHKRQKRTLARQAATCKLQQVSTPRAFSSVQSSPGHGLTISTSPREVDQG